MVEELAQGFIGSGADKDDAKPSQQGNQAAGHPFFSAGVNAGPENNDEKDVESVKGQGVKSHDRVLSFDVRANCIECRRKSSGFCANRAADGRSGSELGRKYLKSGQFWQLLRLLRDPLSIGWRTEKDYD